MINLDTAIDMLLGDTIKSIESKVLKIAKKALKKGIPIEDIAELTELDIETIKELQAQESEEAPEEK